MSETPKNQSRRRPDMDTLYSINTDGSRNFIHPADVRGRWQNRINALWFFVLAVYFGLPWLQLGDKPAVLVDLPGRQAFLLGTTFTNQDFYLMFFLLTGIGFALFVVTAIWGRVLCGFACPQTIFLEGIFRRAERLIEGYHLDRIRRNRGPNTFDKVWRKIIKHLIFIIIASICAHTFIAYFIPVRELLARIAGGTHLWSTSFVWALCWTGILYFNYSWFREQTCLIICPYGRLQSSLIDSDTIIIGYDKKRGEPRGGGKEMGGDCIDCFRCVDVCPTGIDIRNGLQMECLGCTRCIDACDETMSRIKKPRGLIRFDSLRGFASEGKHSWRRPRVLIYAFFGLLGIVISLWAGTNREEYQANILRARGMPYVMEEERIRNLFNLHIQNKSSEPAVYGIASAAENSSELEFIIPQMEVALASGEDFEVPIFVYLPKSAYNDEIPLSFQITNQTTGDKKIVATLFRGP